MKTVLKSVESGCKVDGLLASAGVFPCEVVIVEHWLVEPCVVIAFDCVRELLCEDFVGFHDATYCRKIEFDYFVKSFWSKFKYVSLCVYC